MSFLLRDKILITFQEERGDVFDSVRAILYQKEGDTKDMDSVLLTYMLIDKIVDHYSLIIQHLAE